MASKGKHRFLLVGDPAGVSSYGALVKEPGRQAKDRGSLFGKHPSIFRMWILIGDPLVDIRIR